MLLPVSQTVLWPSEGCLGLSLRTSASFHSWWCQGSGLEQHPVLHWQYCPGVCVGCSLPTRVKILIIVWSKFSHGAGQKRHRSYGFFHWGWVKKKDNNLGRVYSSPGTALSLNSDHSHHYYCHFINPPIIIIRVILSFPTPVLNISSPPDVLFWGYPGLYSVL